ncbi:6,7-dimethyl-8-ribityllumazine synthase [Candidatus Thioglobus sp.]|jgi:6,7-dimethyl-8-ribityllumazine synthase|uniref:6,7-dimethyl-8-ribityllumazine synthase n=1 Tax=Candidatus Thioglobus sp. TaxID=2026721 RepID=UPI001DB11FA0|nr:6,7-dimethyl-8-ribityllumazine synthase [Candidatus Thioglobus sp.]MBT3277558.1 6,7-dimethyl-8-ribityllumazine synthase [Candidatus Thioglobus sp.]MBT3447404.1 6,7-dimethyl-8-ribityllumazine synthase [Candidatus Thioglobus sp.]MBT3744684.1 6,7-dimethyl-8-ribityllumazine synthase [Candidatus Thioglobus sp.]MBT4001662.1 6,7-dimethyl-8-ribityllumazine synthase [Candidatus Thioglobus sp.]MBT4181484.1 6,7-dimethyl-8-ribityllumazine synthase [Candidatus Thioglobus sp.]
MNFQFDKNANSDFLKDSKVAIIVGYFYQDIGDKLLAAAQDTLAKYGINENNVNVFYAPGAFEIPLLAKRLAAQQANGQNLYDGIVTLGAVIKGETPHDVYVCNECSKGIAEVSYNYEIPTTFGVLTTLNMDQTIGRAGGYKGNKGEEATMAMIEMLYLLQQADAQRF